MAATLPTVHVVDDDASFLRATARLLAANGFAVAAHRSATEFLERCNTAEPGCVVADLRMPDLGGLDFQRALARTRNPLPLVFLTGAADTASTVRAMREGAEDFLEKHCPAEELLAAVRRALARDASERAARQRHAALEANFGMLTPREREVLAHVMRGRLNKQIAGDLGIHERTVKLHRMSMMAKLHTRSVAELTRMAQAAGLLPPLEPVCP